MARLGRSMTARTCACLMVRDCLSFVFVACGHGCDPIATVSCRKSWLAGRLYQIAVRSPTMPNGHGGWGSGNLVQSDFLYLVWPFSAKPDRSCHGRRVGASGYQLACRRWVQQSGLLVLFGLLFAVLVLCVTFAPLPAFAGRLCTGRPASVSPDGVCLGCVVLCFGACVCFALCVCLWWLCVCPWPLPRPLTYGTLRNAWDLIWRRTALHVQSERAALVLAKARTAGEWSQNSV